MKNESENVSFKSLDHDAKFKELLSLKNQNHAKKAKDRTPLDEKSAEIAFQSYFSTERD